METFTKQVAEIPADRPALEAALAILRDITSGPTNAVLYELLIAARTDEKLRDTMQHELGQYSREDPRRRPGAAGRGELPRGNVSGDRGAVDERVRRSRPGGGVLPQPEIAEQRIPVLSALLTAALPNTSL